MSQVKGSRKTGGRKKGTVNKRTQHVDEILAKIKCTKPGKESAQQTGYESLTDLIAVRDYCWMMVHQVPPNRTARFLDIIYSVADKIKKIQHGEKTAIEHTGEDGAPLWESLIDMMDDDYKR